MNWNVIIPIIIFISDVLLAWFCYWLGCRTVKPIEDSNKAILEKQIKLKNQLDDILYAKLDAEKRVFELKEKSELLNNEKMILSGQVQRLKTEKEHLEDANIQVQEFIAQSEQLAKEKANAIYEKQVSENEQHFKLIAEDYAVAANNLYKQKEKLEKELESLKNTKAAAIAAAQKEKEIHENKDDYCLILPIEYEKDIQILREVVKRISKPRSILMAIWQAYYTPLAKKKFPKILGKTDVCGIYKITNQQTGECYIGQAVDVRRRWMDHCKAGLGIDTPQGNQLYAAMKEYGLDVFSFELLLECPSNELNEKENYFINLYNSDAIGYNQNRGVKGNN